MTIIWCMVPEIWCVTYWNFCHSGLFFTLLPPYGPIKSKFWKMKTTPDDIIILQMCIINDSHMMNGSWDMECCNGQTFLSFWTNFCPFTPHLPQPLTTQKIKILKTGDIIILHMCTNNDNYMMYGSWDIKRDGQNFLLFWTVFCTFTPLTWKIKI